MGHSAKFVFPLPGRKPKHAPPPPVSAPVSGPFTTKAQKILGTTGLTVDSVAIPGWETQSSSGISIAVTETTNGAQSHTTTRDRRGGPKPVRERRWEQESDILPTILNKQGDVVGSMAADGVTDASSLRRRQSSSTITSYYDKAKLPLAISQQTSNSAMAKGLPAKAQALLDIDGEFNEPPQLKKARKKPSRLDLSSLLHRHRSPKHTQPQSNNNHVPENHTLSKSPSFTSASPTPPPIPQRAERGLKKQVTRESLREKPAQQGAAYGAAGRPSSGKEQPTKASIDLYNLYDHYEQRTFADAMDQEFPTSDYHAQPPNDRPPPSYPLPLPPVQSGKAFLSPFPGNGPRNAHSSKQALPRLTAVELRMAGAGTPSSPVPTDCASISSRHTRTSKASRRTERSLQEIDLLQNSVLALSSDSEDDYEISSKGSLAVPPLSDGQASPSSPRSPMSQTSMGAYEATRGKQVKRTTFATDPQVFPVGQASSAVNGPKITPRTSSLNSKASSQSGHALVHETSRLSINTTSTGRTVSQAQSPGTNAANVTKKAPKKMRSESQFDFPAPPANRGSRSASVSRVSEQSRAAAPTSVDLYLQSQRALAAPDNGSIHSSASLSSAANSGRRGSAASSIHDGSSGRFMAVTRQEEMLLAALRMKRARMREEIIAEFDGDADREEHQLRREMTNDSMAGMSRQSSRSTMRQEAGTLSARPRQQNVPEKERIDTVKILVDRTSYDTPLRTPASEISDFIHFDDSVAALGHGGLERRDSKASSISSQKSSSARQRASLSAMTAASAPRRPQRRDGSTSRRGSEQIGQAGQNDLPHRIPEDPAEDEDHGIPRPDSPISPSDFPTPMSIKNKKQVRLSAVGFYKPSDAGW